MLRRDVDENKGTTASRLGTLALLSTIQAFEKYLNNPSFTEYQPVGIPSLSIFYLQIIIGNLRLNSNQNESKAHSKQQNDKLQTVMTTKTGFE